ncbi:MAG: drug/metabolite exporter YedA [Acidimicrobiia bacterium]|nr:drug/metabolite exporter YedA [Acidimicrobiia bacterium]MDH4308824.1 drug/metabolite exporter YedA [Acidimicrobiia bacterium]MDH5295411.1 drug/metabolite exporter YedA [Acidimicrobiia bacterium]
MKAEHPTPTSVNLVPLALIGVYVIWGSTYLALRFMVEDIPPLLGNSVRLAIAGSILFVVARRHSETRLTPTQLRNGWIVGTLLFVGGVGQVTIAESLGVSSAIAATAIAVTPVWATLVGGVFGSWPKGREWTGLLLGFLGVAALSTEGDFRAAPLGLVLVLAAPVCWSVGSVWSNHMELPAGSMRTAVFMLGGSISLVVAGLLRGEEIPTEVGASSLWALAYLALPGSLLAFSAYAYLLRTVRPGLAMSYAYVNPMVAVLLGVVLGGERLGPGVWTGLPIIVTAVILIVGANR